MTQKQFNRLKPATRRIKIAQDVLATLARPKRSRFTPKQGTYCEIITKDQEFFDGKEYDQLQSLLPQIEKYCTACAMGAFFISHVRLFNKVRVDDTNSSGNSLHVSDERIIAVMRGYFSHGSLRTIESAFEGYDDDGGPWLRLQPDPTRRLRAICRNIIAHKGNFDITDLPKQDNRK